MALNFIAQLVAQQLNK